MPSFSTTGKSKDDLVQVTQIFGLLSLAEAERMTRTELIAFLERANETASAQAAAPNTEAAAAASATEVPLVKPATRSTPKAKTASEQTAKASLTGKSAGKAAPKATVKRSARIGTKAIVADAQSETVTNAEEPVPIEPKRRGRPPKAAKPDETRTPEAESGEQLALFETEPVTKPARGARKTVRTSADDAAAPRKRGRPSRKELAEAANEAVTTGETKKKEARASKPEAVEAPMQKHKLSAAARTKSAPPVSQAEEPQPGVSSDLQETRYESDAEQSAELVQEPEAAITETTAEMESAAEQPPAATPAKEKLPAVEQGEIQGGVLEIMPDGYGFLRRENYLQGSKDIYVPPQYIRRFGLRPGDYVTGPVKLQRENDRFQAILYIKDVNGMAPEKMLRRPQFDKLTPIYPDERFTLETARNELSTRIIDLVAPIGKGQRGMIVSPPKAGKTILLQKIANAVSVNSPNTKLIVLLIDERPEEVTDMQRSIKGEVVYSTFDKTPENHTKVVELVLERAMRLVELKQDVMILLDSMTRLARAYNLTINPTGRTLSGGLDPGALYGPKRFFGAARNIENGGSLTIIATSLIETGSRMDEVIFEEFKGTGNMEVYLDRKLSEKRIFPAIDINKSGTRREELLMNTKELDAVWTIRKAFSQLDTAAVTEAIINLLLKTVNNQHFISSVNVSFNDKNVFEAMRGVRPGQQPQGASGQTQSAPLPDRPHLQGVGHSYASTGYGSNYRRMANREDD